MGIKLGKDDTCLGGALISGVRHVAGRDVGRQDDGFPPGKYELSRGGKGVEAVKRFLRACDSAKIELVDWDQLEADAAAETQGKRVTTRPFD